MALLANEAVEKVETQLWTGRAASFEKQAIPDLFYSLNAQASAGVPCYKILSFSFYLLAIWFMFTLKTSGNLLSTVWAGFTAWHRMNNMYWINMAWTNTIPNILRL
jgi:hypothetical protein